MILLTGATGSVGRHVAADLVAKGLDVRAVVRDPETAGLPAGVEVMRGDLVDPESSLRPWSVSMRCSCCGRSSLPAARPMWWTR
jgi:nucleoside-diphosphate-sugar epimerase